MNCRGCDEEKRICYEYQKRGFNAGLTWHKGHCFVFVLDKKGRLILE